MSYSRYGGGRPDNRGQGQGAVSPWAGGYPNGGNNSSNLQMNLLGTLMTAGQGGNNMATSVATSLIAQALQNKPGGMMIGGHNFGGSGSMNSNMGVGPSRGGYMDRRGGDDYRRGRDSHHPSHRNSSGPRRSGSSFNRRSRSRSRDRMRSRRDHSDQRRPPAKRMRAGSPKDRAPFEIYIGNYPVRFRESDVRKLFEEHDVKVSTIRLKHDGHKVFAFAETDCEEEIQKAIKAMDSKEIHGRRLRVRSSKDKDRNDKAEAAKKKFQPKRELTEDDVTKHLVFAFIGFLTRQTEKEGLDDELKSKMETAKDLLKESFEIPEDESLKVSRNLELIFLQNNRREIPVPKDEIKEEETEETEVKEEEAEDEEGQEEVQEDEEGENAEEQEGEENEQNEENNADNGEENDEEEALIDELGGAIGDLVQDADGSNEGQAEDQEEEQNEETKAEDDDDEEIVEVKEVTSPSRGGGRGRGAGRARRSRGRRGA